jgi:glutathione peroxidase
MKHIIILTFFLLGVVFASDSFYSIKVKNIDGKTVSMSKYKNMVVLIVNTASKCDLANQYIGLEKLYQKYKSKGFAVLAFPSNQFGQLELKSDKAIKKICATKFNITFDMFSKINVNGKKESPLYTYLKKHSKMGYHIKPVKWNFEKFIIGRDGKVAKRFSSMKQPKSIEQHIIELLNKN